MRGMRDQATGCGNRASAVVAKINAAVGASPALYMPEPELPRAYYTGDSPL